ncbi:MAG: UvrD-helicase domain-containing protein [Cyclobacteriaceae bacterium]
MDISPHQKPFHIYKSSAGSGKTYTLTKEYLKIALQRSGAFRQILGVTFTNKATEEMKSRIITVLRDISDGKNPPVQSELEEALKISSAQIKKVASSTLTDILHQYGRFSVVTIDSFFHQVIRSFAREMGLQGSFSIDLDLPAAMQQVIDEMLLDVGNDDKKQLKKWLVQFAEERVENGDSWDIRREINGLAGQILTDEFKPYSKAVLELSKDSKFFIELKKRIDQTRYAFEGNIKAHCARAIKLMKDGGVDPADFKGGKTQSPANLFFKVPNTFEVTDAQRKKAGDRSAWLKDKDPKLGVLESILDSGLADCYDEIIATIEKGTIDYQSAKESLRYFYTYGILSEINKKIQEYRDQNDVMLIADLPDFLHQIINDSETPYIYEKVGSLFQNYLIDEFQDTSVFQWENFKPLVKNSSDEGNFGMVVGDVKQSIYRWRGGDWQLLQNQLKEDIGGYHVNEESLTTNWRSDYQVVDFNNTFFVSGLDESRRYFGESLQEVKDEDYQKKIAVRIEEVLSTYEDVKQEVPAHKSEDEGFVRIGFIGEEEGEDWRKTSLIQTIKATEEAQRQGFELRDIAILTRTKPEGKKVANAFMEYKNSDEVQEDLKYDVVSSEALYLTSSHLVRFVISMIKWLNNESNTIVLAEWLFEYERYIIKSDKNETNIFSSREYWKNVVPQPFVLQKDYLKTLPLYELVERLVGIFDLDKKKEEFIYLQGFQDAILDYSKNERGDISSFLEWWEKVKDKKTIQISDDNNAIKIMTIHKSKGLEFPVVIIPFLNWELDHSATNDNILWCEGGEIAPFNQLPVLPLRYSSKLANTYWAMEYYDEKLKAFLDNLNLLYVAFTRAASALIAFGKLPKPPKGADKPNLDKLKIKTIGDFALSTLKSHEGFEDEEFFYTKGKWGTSESIENQNADEFSLEKYHSHPWREKANIQMRDALESGETVFSEATQQGIRIHDLISRVKYKTDLEFVLDTPERTFITKVIEDPKIADWFDEKWKVDTEVTVLLPSGDFKRIDRINRSSTETLVIDFKTGSPRNKDNKQVREYIQILTEMGFANVKGRLVYLADMDVREV